MKNTFTLMLVIITSLALSGCWESTDVTIHQAGKYMGTKDPLLATSGASRAEGLQKRFQLVQVDR